MHKIKNITISIFITMVLFGCGHSSREILKLVEERDSLKYWSDLQAAKLSGYGHMIEIINATLDSIAIQEKMIFLSKGETPVTKEDVQYNLSRFEAVLHMQQNKIDELENQLTARDDTISHAFNLITHLREQIGVKNKQIIQLRNELEKKNVDITQLKNQVESQRLTINTQNATITELNNRAQKQREALARQDAILNNGYVLIGSKEDLKRKGILTKKGSMVSEAMLDRTKFAKVDIRVWQEINFTARKPTILTNMPPSSYELTTTGNKNFTLVVKNPSDFWRISTYLVIQTD